MKRDIESGEGFVASYNTKSGARVAFRELRDAITDPVLKAGMRYYDGDTDKNIDIARECLEDWNGFGVIHNSKITTALDYHPTKPINSYNFTNGVSTVCPATTLQMILRARNIKQVYFCPYNMPEEAQFADKEAFFANLEFVYPLYHGAVSTPGVNSQRASLEVSVLREINDVAWSPKLRKHIYSEIKFSLGYKEWLWERYLMDASYVCNTVTLTEKRGFVVTPADEEDRICIPDYAKIGIVKKQCRQDDEEALLRWKQGEKIPQTYFFNQRLLAVSSVCRGLKPKTDASILLREKNRFDSRVLGLDPIVKEYIHRIFTCDKALKNNQNVVLGIYTFAKLQSIALQQQTKNYEISCRYNTISTAMLYREMITAWNEDMPRYASLKPYNLTIKQGNYDEDEEFGFPDSVWDQYKRRLGGVSDRPTTRKTVLECVFVLSQEFFGTKYNIQTKTTRKVEGVDIKCYNYSCDFLALDVFTILANWTDCDLKDFEPAIVTGYELMKKGPRSDDLRPISDKGMQKEKNARKKQAMGVDMQRKSVAFYDDAQRKRHEASHSATDSMHNAFFEARHELIACGDLSSPVTDVEQEKRDEKRRKIDLMYKNQDAPVETSVEAQQAEYKRQSKQVKVMNYCERRYQYRIKFILETASRRILERKNHVLMRSKIILKMASKRALAQKNYALLCLDGPGDLKSMMSI